MEADQKTLEGWLREYRRIIYKILMIYGNSPADREDLYQEIALGLWRSLPSFEGRSAESTWVYRVALNTALTHLRQGPREEEELASVEPLSDQLTPEESQELIWIYARIRTLDPVERSLVLLYLEGQSYQEIGDILGTSSGAVGVKLTRIKQQLKDLLTIQV